MHIREFVAAAQLVDLVVEEVTTALRLLQRKIAQLPPKKHGNIPL